eukprot:4079889-Prymnesium_polylepis.1
MSRTHNGGSRTRRPLVVQPCAPPLATEPAQSDAVHVTMRRHMLPQSPAAAGTSHLRAACRYMVAALSCLQAAAPVGRRARQLASCSTRAHERAQ